MVTQKKIIKNNKTNTKTKLNTYLNNSNFVPVQIKLTEKHVELLLLYTTIINYFLLLINNKVPKNVIKTTILNLFRELRNHNQIINKKTSDYSLEIVYSKLYKQISLLKKQIDKDIKTNKIEYNSLSSNTKNSISIPEQIKIITKHASGKDAMQTLSKNKGLIGFEYVNNPKHNPKYNPKHNSKYNPKHNSKQNPKHNPSHDGGFYFKSLEEKGDQPLTGADLATLLDEVQQFFYNAQYTEEGKFLQDTNALISMLRGDTQQFKSLVQYRIFPQYYQITPPFIRWDNIKKAFDEKKYEDLPDYLLAYQSYLRSRDEYLVAKGLKSPSVLNNDLYSGFYNKLANSLDQNIQQFQQYRNKATLQMKPITLPV